MRFRYIVIAVVLVGACSTAASAYVLVVEDLVNLAEHILLTVWEDSINSVLDEHVAKIGQMVQRLTQTS